MMVSQTVLVATNFGPSKALCDEFVDRVIEQAKEVGVEIEMEAV